MDSSTPWRVQTFGGFAVERQGVRFDRFRTRHAAALLAYLAAKPDVRHSREVVAEVLWPDAEPIAARQRLSTALATLRRDLESNGAPVFDGGRDSIAIHPGMLTSDAVEVDRLIRQARGASRERRADLLAEALTRLERGEFLPGFYFEWTLEQSSRFGEIQDAIRSELEAAVAKPTLPAEDPSSLVGRVAEIEALEALLQARHRCISILGAGGVGKTRLALDLFERNARSFPGATAFVRLAEVRDPSEFLPALARALHLSYTDAGTLPKLIADALAIPSLIVLDNLEHLLPAVHASLDQLIRACGAATFVGTSRRRLDVAGEQVLRVRPLTTAPTQAGEAEVADAPAIRLFLARYAEAGGAALPPESLEAVNEICRALGGLPLTIQLAASASVAVGVEALREEAMLYKLLPARSPDATNPHASLSEMIAWSLTLLDAPTRRALDALCILPGSFQVEMVQQLWGEEVAAALPRLHSDSLLEADSSGTMRVLEPIRDHVRGQMSEATQRELETNLLRQCARLAQAWEARLEGTDQRSAMEDVNAIWPTMRLAVQFAREHGMPNEGLEIVSALSRSFIVNNTSNEAITLGGPLIEQEGVESRVLARAHATLARHSYFLAQLESSRRHGQAGLAVAETVGDRQTEARCLNAVGFTAIIREDQAEALALAGRALEVGRQGGDVEAQTRAHLVLGHAHALYQRGVSEEEFQRSRAQTEAHMAAAVAIAREGKDDLMEATSQYHRAAYAGSDLDLYHARLSQAIEIYRRNGWKLREAFARTELVRRLYTAGLAANVLEELHSLQRVYADWGQWHVRAEQVAIEAEVLFRMNRHEEALVAIDDALEALRRSGRPVSLEHHVQALIYAALGKPELESPLLSIIDHGDRSEFSAMMAELARSLMEARRGEDARAFRRLQNFRLDDKPTRVLHAFADTLVAFADMVALRNRGLAVAAYRKARPVYREIKSAIDLRRVRDRVAAMERASLVLG